MLYNSSNEAEWLSLAEPGTEFAAKGLCRAADLGRPRSCYVFMKRLAARVGTVRAIVRESVGGARICSGFVSTVRMVADIILYRALRLGNIPGENRTRSIRLKSGDQIIYRLNRGDIQSIREVMIDQVYRPPFKIDPRVIVDLGANIGLTSLYLNRQFRPEVLVAVEPDPENAALARQNLSAIGARVLEAAVAPRDGVGPFSGRRDSNLGALGEGEDSHIVRLISMSTILSMLPGGRIDLLKMDIEGGEQELLTNQTEWLSSVDAIIAEFHPDSVDYCRLVQQLMDHGFRYIPAGAVWRGSMDAFIRDSVQSS